MQFNKKVLSNGLRIITIPMKDNPTVTALVMVEAGSKYETKEISGVSHFLEHMCFKGTDKRPTSFDITRELDGMGSQYNAFTSNEFTGYYAKSRFHNSEKILDVISDLYLHQRFDPAEIEEEKGVIVEEINMYEDAPKHHVHDLFTTLLYGDTPAGWNVAGNKESVTAMKQQNFQDYRKKHYVSGATLVVIAGSFDEEKMLIVIEEKFKGIHDGEKHGKTKVLEPQTAPQIVVKKRETDQVHLVLGVRSYNTFAKEIPTANVLANILGGGMSSRLFQKLRDDMGVAYYISAFQDSYTDHGYMAVTAGVDRNRIEESIKVILSELKKFTHELVSKEELERTKEHMIGNLYLELESSDSVAHYYGLQEILRKPLLTPREMAEEIQAVTAEDIKKVAEQIFEDSHLNLAIVGNIANPEVLTQALTFM